MPELPEIETIRRGLEARLVGNRISAVEIFETRLRRPLDPSALRRLVDRKVEAVSRRAKYLLVDVGEGLRWLVHLGMSGRLVFATEETMPERHEHVRVRFGAAGILRYCDPRRFGLMRIGMEDELEELRGLGPEPIPAPIDTAWFYRRLRGSRREIKAALLDQRLIAGIGNIYANEILYRAGVRPTRRGIRLRRAESDRIAAAIAAVLTEAIERRGTSFSDYFDSDGIPGTFQTVLTVFDRTGERCVRCGAAIKRRLHGGRSSFYCPRCQR